MLFGLNVISINEPINELKSCIFIVNHTISKNNFVFSDILLVIKLTLGKDRSFCCVY